MTPPQHYIDRFMIFFDTVIARGWCEKRGPGKVSIEISHKGHLVATFVEEIHRPDLEKIYGPGAGSWGFVSRALLPTRDGPENVEEDLVMRICAPGVDEVTIQSPSKRFGSAEDTEFHGIFAEFVQTACAHGGRVLEIGARARSGVARRDLFPPPVAYVGLDVSPGPNVDVVGDAHQLTQFVTGRFDFVFSISTFEHLLMPWKVVLEINKVLNTGGVVFTHSHQSWPVHDEPWDFWRFTREGWHGLYNRHTGFEILKTKQAEEAFLSSRFPWPGLDREICYRGSCCVARKIGQPQVAWDAEMDGVYDLAYSHGPTYLNPVAPKVAAGRRSILMSPELGNAVPLEPRPATTAPPPQPPSLDPAPLYDEIADLQSQIEAMREKLGLPPRSARGRSNASYRA